jgi:hypothetical protein
MKKVFIVETEDGVPYLHHPDYDHNAELYSKPNLDIKAAWQHLANHFHKKDIYVAVQPDVLEQISEDGRVKNQHETNSSRGILNPEMRAEFEHHFFKDNLSSIEDKPLPIYGYMSSHPMASKWMPVRGGDVVNQYGSVRLKIKPHLRPVTTFTRDDSLNQRYEDMTPSFVTHPHWKSLTRYIYDDMDKRSQRSRSLFPKKDDVENYTTPNEAKVDNGNMIYHEAQIHSEVHMHDIDSIHVMPNHSYDDVDYRAIGEKHGIPVYYYNIDGDRKS